MTNKNENPKPRQTSVMVSAVSKPINVIENGEYVEPFTFESDSESVLFSAYLKLLEYVEYLEKNNGNK